MSMAGNINSVSASSRLYMQANVQCLLWLYISHVCVVMSLFSDTADVQIYFHFLDQNTYKPISNAFVYNIRPLVRAEGA